jgi:hypothetical protein
VHGTAAHSSYYEREIEEKREEGSRRKEAGERKQERGSRRTSVSPTEPNSRFGKPKPLFGSKYE